MKSSTQRRSGALWAVLALGLLGSGAPSTRARADDPVAAASEVLIVLGSNEGSEVDSALKPLTALAKPPFDGFTRKSLLKRVDVLLQSGKDSEVSLPNGRTLRLTLVEKLPDGRVRLRVSINRPGERDYLPLMTVTAAPGDPFFIAGQKYQGGTLILGVRVAKPAK